MESLYSAIADFRRARRKAAVEEIFARITGKSSELLSYDEVLKNLRLQGQAERGLHDIPLDAVVGSVGRYSDFTRDFFPRFDWDQQRWAAVKLAFERMTGIPPIEVYQIGSVYFVKDGNHRVSVAKMLGAKYIQAYVIEVRTRVPLTPDIDTNDLIIKSEYARFLEVTSLDVLRPEADLSVSDVGLVDRLLDHISVHRYFMGIDEDRPIEYQEAVLHWYDKIYLPVVETILAQGILEDFAGRTEADLYLWLMEYRSEIQSDLGWQVRNEAAAANLGERFGNTSKHIFTRIVNKCLDLLIPDQIEAGPSTGNWRKRQSKTTKPVHLFTSLMVPLQTDEIGWAALEQAIIIAQREKAQILGLHIISSDSEKQTETVLSLQTHFNQRIEKEELQGSLAIESGSIARKIIERCRWSDLIVVKLSHPPAPQPVERLRSGFSQIIRRSRLPLLAVPNQATQLKNALLAYDDSPQAREALYVATYLHTAWGTKLVVLSVSEKDTPGKGIQAYAAEYLKTHKARAQFLIDTGAPDECILNQADGMKSDLIIMGSYGFTPVVEVMMGSTVDQVLNRSQIPVLLCR